MAGCGTVRRPTATTRPAEFGWVGKASLTLDQIEPKPCFLSPATNPTTRPAIDALILFSQARDASIWHQPKAAAEFLERALKLDPDRYELQFALAEAYSEAGDWNHASSAYERATQLRPDSFEANLELGHLLLEHSNQSDALNYLRLAVLSPEYSQNDAQATVADCFLGRALKAQGYDRAAMDQFTQVLTRLNRPGATLLQNPQLISAMGRPESLLVDLGELLEKHGDYDDALRAFKPAVDRETDNLPLQTRYAKDLALNGQRDDAINHCVNLVEHQRASAASLQVLREVCRSLNINDGVTSELRKLSARQPGDRAVLFALADTLISKKRMTEALDVLQAAWQKYPGDVAITRRLFMVDKQLNQVEAAAAVLIHAAASDPDVLENFIPLWMELLSYSRPNRLRVVTVQLMKLDREDEAARQVMLAVTAFDESRYVLQRESLESACKLTPPFAPAFRMLLDLEWHRQDRTDAEKIKTTDELATIANRSGDGALAAELRGRAQIDLKQLEKAAESFLIAQRLGGRSPNLLLAAAQVERDLHQESPYKQIVMKIIAEHPTAADAYEALYDYCEKTNAAPPVTAEQVLSAWQKADPQSNAAPLLEAQEPYANRAGRDLDTAFADDPDYPKLVSTMIDFYRQSGGVDKLLEKLEAARAARPRDTELASHIAVLYSQQNRRAEAVRLLDDTRALVSDSADSLYALVDTYLSLDQDETARDVLQQVVQIDPTHAGACNGLGFEWADQGKNLPQAEQLIRIALAKEPDNVRFLDSLGWVLYKRGSLADAKKTFEEAIAPMASPNPMVLNHLGDVLDKMQKHDEAMAIWQRSLKGLSDDHLDQKKVRLRLIQKIKGKS